MGILLYSDDIVLLAESESELQKMLNAVNLWCFKWRLAINQSITHVMHFRKKGIERSTYIFSYGSVNLDYVSSYKYLGFVLDDFLTKLVLSHWLIREGEL